MKKLIVLLLVIALWSCESTDTAESVLKFVERLFEYATTVVIDEQK